MLKQNFEFDGLLASMQGNSGLEYKDSHRRASSFQLYKNVTELIRTHRYVAALLELAGVAPDYQQDPLFWHFQGEALANLGRYQDALKSFDQALDLNADAVETLVFQAVCWIHLQHFDRALDCCDRALAIKPEDSQAWLFRGVALQRLGRYRAAYSSYDQALNVTRPSLVKRVMHWLFG